ncbi:MAG: Rieske (2Fe-2S) protein [Thermoguttaceae bacterium]|jgi:Rieske Fe-S protein
MTTPSSPAPDNRRGFLAKLLALGLGIVALAVPALSALAAFLNPWRQKSEAGKWIRVASNAALPADGSPQRCPVIADRSDAWNRYPDEAIGAIFLCRVGDKEIVALQTICPHNGGCVSYDPDKKNFYCPAHGALFDLQGRRLDEKSISPRDLDSLEVEIRDGTEVWVKFERFQDGTSQKIVKT